MAQSGVPANNFAHNRNSIAQNSSAPAASSNPAAQQTSQPSGSSSSDQADSQPSAFMAALISATLDDSGSNLLAKPLATAGANSTIVNGRRLNTLKQPSRIGNQEALAVAVPTSLTTPPVLPLRFSLPSRDPEEDSIPDGDNAASNSGAQADNASEPAKRTADAATAAESQANSSEELTFAARGTCIFHRILFRRQCFERHVRRGGCRAFGSTFHRFHFIRPWSDGGLPAKRPDRSDTPNRGNASLPAGGSDRSRIP